MLRNLIRQSVRPVVYAASALLGALLMFAIQVAVSRRLAPHAQFIVAAGLGASVGAIAASVAIGFASRGTWRQLLSVLIGSVPGALLGVAAGRATLNLLGAFGLVAYPLAVGFCAYGGYRVVNGLLSLRQRRVPREPNG